MGIQKIILGSQSPRRHELIKHFDIPIEIINKSVEEIYPNNIPLKEIPQYLAKLKAAPYENDLKSGELLMTFDTMVLLRNEIIGKPKDLEDAIETLKNLRNQKHDVITGVCLKMNTKEKIFSEITEVYFGDISDDYIKQYVYQNKPLDKAGAYAIQESIGILGIEKIIGCFYNVMGLPVSRVRREMSHFDELI